MRAAVSRRYGDPQVVVITQLADPSPGPRDVVVRVDAAAVTAADARIRAARFPRGFAPMARLMFGISAPRRRVLGSAFAGTVVTIGAAVTDWQPGDRVAGMAGMAMGAHAELLRVPATKLVAVPDGVELDAAAAVLFGGTTAWHFLHRVVEVRPRMTVLVNGAAGAVGSSTVQLARHLGATVTAVTRAANEELVRELGAVAVIDYRRTPVTSLTGQFDVVVDAVGNLTAATGKPLLRPTGRLYLAVADLWQTISARGQVTAGSSPESTDDMATLLDLLDRDILDPVITRTFPLAELPAAHALVDSGRKVGNAIVRPQL